MIVSVLSLSIVNIQEQPLPTEAFMSSREVCERYGMSLVTLRRYLDNERLGFPQPLIINARRKLWRVADLVEWEQSRTTLAVRKTA